MNEQQNVHLTGWQQLRFFGIGLCLISFLVGSFSGLIYLSQSLHEQTTWSWELLKWASVGGLFGGSARALSMFILEIGGKGEKKDNISFYSERWFLYVFKPFMGGASGVLFFLTVNLGLASALTSKSTFEIPSIILVSAVGGIFFEEVFGILQRRIQSSPKQETK